MYRQYEYRPGKKKKILFHSQVSLRLLLHSFMWFFIFFSLFNHLHFNCFFNFIIISMDMDNIVFFFLCCLFARFSLIHLSFTNEMCKLFFFPCFVCFLFLPANIFVHFHLIQSTQPFQQQQLKLNSVSVQLDTFQFILYCCTFATIVMLLFHSNWNNIPLSLILLYHFVIFNVFFFSIFNDHMAFCVRTFGIGENDVMAFCNEKRFYDALHQIKIKLSVKQRLAHLAIHLHYIYVLCISVL